LKAISYLSFSTKEQKLGNSTERQIQAARDYCRRNTFELDENLSIADEGLSAYKGHHVERGSLGHFLAEVEAGKIPKGTALIVEKLDRLSREGPDETTDILKALTKNGVEVHVIASGAGNAMVLKHGFNKNLNDYIMIGLQAHLAYQESLNKSDRISSVWASKKDAAIASGTPFGKSLPVWLTIEGQVKSGSRIIIPGKIVVVPEKVALVQEIFRLAAQGVGSNNIVHQLNERVLSRSWVIWTLKNRAVLGEFQPKGREVIQGYYPQIITQSEFDAARAQVKTKIRHGKYTGGNRKNSLLATNLFQYLLLDITTEPIRTMQFQESRGLYYVMSAFDKGGRPSNRIRYDKLEKALLGFLETVEWLAIAGESESNEYKGAMAALEAKLRLRDAISREITSNTEAMQGEDVDTRRQFMRENAKHEAVLATLTHDIEALQASVAEAQAKSAGLSETKTFFELLNQFRSNPSLRLPMKAAIQKKVSRIELVFMPDRQGVVAFLQYTNGAPDATVVLNKDIHENAPWAATMPAALRSSGHFRIQRIRNQPLEYHEGLKAATLKWVRSFANMEEAA
jgi:DNA invertase Pin-like site-specific DNA recombinase